MRYLMVGEDSETPIRYVDREELTTNKRLAGRPKDLDDMGYLAGEE